MENFNLDENIIPLQETSNLVRKNPSPENKSFHLSNPIFTEMLNFSTDKDEVYYEFKIAFKDEKWVIKRNLTEI